MPQFRLLLLLILAYTALLSGASRPAFAKASKLGDRFSHQMLHRFALPILTRSLAQSVVSEPTPTSLESIRYDNLTSVYQINSDYTYTLTLSERKTLLSVKGVQEGQRSALSFYPDSQSLELVEAYVIQPDGQKVLVSQENIFTRSSPEAEDAPGFTNSMTTTVVFPQLGLGSQTFVKWKLIQKKPSVIGFSSIDSPAFKDATVRQSVQLILPAGLPLKWQKRGDYRVTDRTHGKQRVITATIEHQPGQAAEKGMVDEWDVQPLFVFSNLNSWEEIGKLYWQQSQDKVQVTPEIKALANQIAGNQQGLEAAQAIHNWVAQNIDYVAVYLNESAGYVPHSATEVLKNGYGDCKDHVVLMQSLLAAKGIESYPVLVDWGSLFTSLPLPTTDQFNHAMIYLPAYQKFANPTDQYAALGELDVSLRNKFVVIASKQGAIAQTPPINAAENRYMLTQNITIANDGTVDGTGEITVIGTINHSIRSLFVSDSAEKIANEILAQTPEGGFGRIIPLKLDNLAQSPILKTQWSSPYAITLRNWTSFSVPIGVDLENPHHLRGYITPGQRRYPLIAEAMTWIWNYRITIPEGYQINRLPEATQFSNAAGEYNSHYQADPDARYIMVQRNLVLKQDVYNANEYPALRALIYQPVNDARSAIVLKKR
ncbi:MAG: DUF3857 domain-containing protein [Scytolyngbya sp. HA4215-MV1]|jgi:hypothetical protein|nr:DUF3857 domain-containing protein [Scytolyngbya sp. HA4215-MV1]